MTESYLFAGANFAICMGIVFICLCRNNVMNRRVLQRVRAEYAGYIGASMASAFSPWWGEWPSWGQTGMGAMLFIGLWISGIGWRKGPPESATSPAPLGDE